MIVELTCFWIVSFTFLLVMLLAFLSPVAINIGYYLSYKDIALISNSASDNALDNKQAYDTVIRPGFAFKQIGDAVVAVRLVRSKILSNCNIA